VKRFLATAAAALFLGLGSAGKADAQIVYGYNNVPGNGGYYSNRTVAGVGATQTYNSFYSPFTGTVRNQVTATNWLGQTYSQSSGYNPWSGVGYNSAFYRPNYYAPPMGGFNYYRGYGYGNPWGWR